MKSKFSTIFTSIAVKCITDKEKDELLALASLEQLRRFIPDAANVNDGFLPIAFNAFTPNRINKNDDVIDTKTAIAIYKKFINTPINIEHKRGNVIGVILSAGFSEFGTDKVLTEEEVKDYKKPFNVTLGGVVWKVVNSELAELIQDSNDPTSSNYMSISASWELGFSGYNLLLLDKGQKNTDGGKFITDGAEVEKYKEKLRALGGEGVVEEKRLYRMPSEDVEPLGIGLTEKPAGDVKGVATKTIENPEIKATFHAINKCDCGVIINQTECEEAKASESIIPNGCPACVEKQNNISQTQKPNVKLDKIMKINSISDITDETLKQCSASTISDFIADHVKEKSAEWDAAKKASETKANEAIALANKAKEDLEKVTKEFEKIKASFEALEKEKQEREAVDKFNERMGKIAEDYDLDDEVRAAILDEVKAIESDEAFAKWEKKAAAIFKPFKKGLKKDKDGKPIDPEAEKKAKADEAKAALDAAMENGKKDKAGLPNSSDANEKSMKNKYANSFAKDQFVITK